MSSTESRGSVPAHVAFLLGGTRPFFDPVSGRELRAAVIYVPWGCPDWGERNGKRLMVCTFCELPDEAARYRARNYPAGISEDTYIDLFRQALEATLQPDGLVDMVQIFNAGSFLAMPKTVQLGIAAEIRRHPSIQHVVVESRVKSRDIWLITDKAVGDLAGALPGCRITIRIGIETKDDEARFVVFRKGHTEEELRTGAAILRRHDVRASGYVMLLGRGISRFNEHEAVLEACETLDWILSPSHAGGLGMDEVCFRPLCIEPNTPLTVRWWQGEVRPATLWMIYAVLLHAQRYGRNVILLPQQEEPEFAAVSSNHVPRGIAQDLHDAAGCDREFHELLERYRHTWALAEPPSCTCRPSWYRTLNCV